MEQKRYDKFTPDILEGSEEKWFYDYYEKLATGKIDLTSVKSKERAIQEEIKAYRSFYYLGIQLMNRKNVHKLDQKDLLVLKMIDTMKASIPISISSPFFKQSLESRKVYVFQKDFYDVFKNVNLDNMQFSHLPKNTIGFVQLPSPAKDKDGSEYMGFFFFCGKLSEVENAFLKITTHGIHYEYTEDVIGFSWCDSDFTQMGYAIRPYPKDANMFVRDSRIHYPVPEDLEAIKIMFNLLCYINSGNPDLRDYKNPITYQSPNSKTPVKNDKNLSPLNIVEVGFGYKKPNLQHTESWYVPPYLGWRRCGIGRTQLKLSFISGHTKKWKNLR